MSREKPELVPIEDQLCALAMRNPALLKKAIGYFELPLAAFEGAAARSAFEILSRLHSSEPANDHLGRELGDQGREYLDRLNRFNASQPDVETGKQLEADIAGLVLRLRESWLAAEDNRIRQILKSEADPRIHHQAVAAMNDLHRQRQELIQQRNRLLIST